MYFERLVYFLVLVRKHIHEHCYLIEELYFKDYPEDPLSLPDRFLFLLRAQHSIPFGWTQDIQ